MEKIMRYRLNKLSTRAKLIAGALALVMVGVLHASGTQVGGGATLPSILYVGSNAAIMTQVSGSNIDSTSLFGVYDSTTGNTSSYCLTGSGSGKDILAGIVNNNVQNICPTAANGRITLHGFGAPAVGRTDLTQPNFVGADAPLSVTDYNNYISAYGANHFPVQFPVVVGSVAIAFNLYDNLPGVNNHNQVTSSEVNFSDLQLCQIFSGQITDWSDPRLASAFHLTDGGTIPSAPINVQYRVNGSGTSFSLSNHLSTVCNSSIGFFFPPPGGGTNSLVFETSQTFFSTTAGTTSIVQSFFPAGLPSGDGVTTPKWTGLSSDSALANVIGITFNTIGYVETANALATAPNLQIADVNGTNPITNFNVSPITLFSDATNAVISNTNNPNGTPVIQPITNPPGTKCIVMVKPSTYAVPGTGLVHIIPPGSYPIVAFSYFLGNSAGNGADLAATQDLVTSPYSSAITSQVTPVGGLEFIALVPYGTNGIYPFTSSQVSGCYGL